MKPNVITLIVIAILASRSDEPKSNSRLAKEENVKDDQAASDINVKAILAQTNCHHKVDFSSKTIIMKAKY